MSQAADNRLFPRGRFTDPVQFHSLDEKYFGGSVGCDVSEGGIKLSAGAFIPVHTELSLQIQFAKDNVWHCSGKVVWVEELPFYDRFRMGIEFSDIESKLLFQKQIQPYIHGSV